MAAVGSAVGPGNMWRFPYQTADGGGAAFVLLYLGMTFLIGIPIMVAEFGVGRTTRLSSIGALRSTGGRGWVPVGYLYVLTSLLIVSYLSVIAGWTTRYALDGMLHGFSSEAGARFAEVSTGPTAVAFHLLVMALTIGIVVLGIKRGIERICLVLMPILFLILISLAVWASTLDGAGPGYAFYLTPSISALKDPTVLQGAASQAFFSLSVGMGIMITYGSYISKHENLSRAALIVSLSDFSIAFVAGLVVFPVIFALGLSGQVTESTLGTLFISLPGAFFEMGAVGRMVGVGFFVALLVASITSMVSLLEVVASAAIDEFGLQRKTAALVAGALAAVLGVVSATTNGALGVFDQVAGDFFVVVGVLAMSLLVGWRMNEPVKEIATGATEFTARLVPGAVFLVRYVIPPLLAILAIVALRDTVRSFFG